MALIRRVRSVVLPASADLAVASGFLGAAALFAASPPEAVPGFAAVPTALLLTVVLPGYGLGRAVVPRVRGGAERLIVTLAFGLIAPIVAGLCFYALAVPIDRPAWMIGSTAVTAMALLVAAIRSSREGRPARLYQRNAPRPRELAALAASALVVMLALALRTGGVSAPESRFTQIWIDGGPRSERSSVELGVANFEGSVETYRIELDIEGRALESMVITLAQAEEWTRPITWDAQTGLDVEATLYRSSDDAVPYRRVSLSVPASG